MKLHRIVAENLNSLYGRQELDLDGALGAAPLFLVVGPTGSGKSTLLDAVCLALFGTTPRLRQPRSGSESSEDDARRIMSWGTDSCAATLEFSRKDAGLRRRFRAVWSCRRARSQKPGRPGRLQDPVRTLEQQHPDGSWELLVSSHLARDFGPPFGEAVGGMDEKEFGRAMLLAQGQFAAFLHAEEEERAAILERLTDSGIYLRLGARAAERRRQADEALALARAALASVRVLPDGERAALETESSTLDAELAKAAVEAARAQEARRLAEIRDQWRRRLLEAEQALSRAAAAAAQGAQDAAAAQGRLAAAEASAEAAEAARLLAEPELRRARDLKAALAAAQKEESAARAGRDASARAAGGAVPDVAAALREGEAAREAAVAAERKAQGEADTAMPAGERERLLGARDEVLWALGLVRQRHHLREGEDCPLCGSPSHPAVGNEEQRERDRSDEAALQERVGRIEAALRHADALAASAKAARDALALAERRADRVRDLAAREAELRRREEERAARAAELAAAPYGENADAEERRLEAERIRARAALDTIRRAAATAAETVARAQAMRDGQSARREEARRELDAAGAALRAEPLGLDPEAADAAVLRAAAEAAAARADGLRDRLATGRARLQQDDAERSRAKALTMQVSATEGEFVLWQRLHRLIGVGDGERFQRFAQVLNLGELMERANLHLLRLSPRFRLVAARDDAGHPRMAFSVQDRWQSDSPRPISTLSGGETFQVSLALALGLAEFRTVRMPIETLLLDEGFGALDPDSLEQALAALQALQSSGTQVGVISHVEALRERIPAQVRVIPEADGRSRLEVAPPGWGSRLAT
jgi:exonuclease SbcC